MSRPTAWLDLVSPSHPFFFDGLLEGVSGVELKTTVRRKTETVDLAEQAGFDYEELGRDFDNVLLRTMGVPARTLQLVAQAPSADVSLSARNAMCVLASKARGVPSIHFTDNDITAYADVPLVERLYCRFRAEATHQVVPRAFAQSELTRFGADPERIHTYDGYKEDLYVATFDPDPTFPATLPFEDYVVVRPEALGAAYVDEEASLVPDLLAAATDAGLNVVYLPRRPADEAHADPYDEQVFVPDEALDGLQLAWYSDGVLTGSGTMAREAACMGKPAVSFFPGPLLSVDREMVEEGMVFHSRDPAAIVDHLRGFADEELIPSRRRSTRVHEQATDIVQALIERPEDPAIPEADRDRVADVGGPR